MGNPLPATLDLLARVAAGDASCADEVERMGYDLLELADRLRATKDPYQSVGSIGDSAALKVVAPDGTVRQHVDTRAK